MKMNCPPLYCIINKNEDEINFTYNKNEINNKQQWYEITIGIDEDLYRYLRDNTGKNLLPIKNPPKALINRIKHNN